MERIPLKPGSLVSINNRSYEITRKIAEGGFSLIYDACYRNAGGSADTFVVKEYFPADGAFRNSQDRVSPAGWNEESFSRNLERFRMEEQLGREIASFSHQAFTFREADGGYALMEKFSEDICTAADLEARWSQTPPVPLTGDPADRDPCFSDYVRIKSALAIVERLLDVIGAMHRNGFLHLDITCSNVCCAGQNPQCARNLTVLLTDYGCTTRMTDGQYLPIYPNSYSPGFAAPEVNQTDRILTAQTDLYSVGKVLVYLCIGRKKFLMQKYLNTEREISDFVSDELNKLDAADPVRKKLGELVRRSICEQDRRFRSAEEMADAVRTLNNLIPDRPITPDDTREFTLCSLRSMLEGSLATSYSWAHELRDRRHLDGMEIPASACRPVAAQSFADDADFLKKILPEELYGYLQQCVQNSGAPRRSLHKIMSGNYDPSWRDRLIGLVRNYGIYRLCQACQAVRIDAHAFQAAKGQLFEILEEDGQFLADCYYYSDPPVRRAPYLGLAMFTLYALLGPAGFKQLISDVYPSQLFCLT